MKDAARHAAYKRELRCRKAQGWRRPTLEENFWSKVRKSDGCWEWTGGKSRWGYGIFACGGCKTAHRVAYAMAHGPIPDGMQVLHRCDNPACVRADHLFIGTNADNVADKVSKGRQWTPVGEKHPRSKLTVDQVREIRAGRAAGVHGKDLAARYGVTHALIYAIANRRVWKHVA